MNTDIHMVAEGSLVRVERGFEAARRFIEDSERRFTRFSPESELSQLTSAAGTWFGASSDLVFVVMLARQYVNLTRGLFDPSILPDLMRAGYDTSMDTLRSRGSLLPAPFGAPRQRVPMEDVQVLPEQNLIYLPPGLSLDLGGIAKGWIAEQASTLLADYASACMVNAGGDLVMLGLPEGESAWQIGIEDPFDHEAVLAAIRVPPGAVATSSSLRRTWKQGDKQRHHLIDPRTGEPAESDWVSVTVYSSHADLSEVFAKALLIAGPQEAAEIASDIEGLAYIAVDREGKLWGTPESMELVYEHE